MTLTGTQGGFVDHLIISLCIGLFIHSLAHTSQWLLHKKSQYIQLIGIAIAIITGSYFGLNLGFYVSNIDLLIPKEELQHIVLTSLPFGLLFGGMISWFYFSRTRLSELRTQAKEEEIRRIAGEKELIQAQLKLLQAQIEPHFLFNTLANVHSLIPTQPKMAATMLENLNHYLRAALDHSRSATTPLAKELDLLKAYLDIQKVRMGNRLSYRFDVPDHIAACPFPPMLLQPLVENSVKHGLEPKLSGGNIELRARMHHDTIEIILIDNGVGMNDDCLSGIGLSNVRERLSSLFDGQASLNITSRDTGGVAVYIRIPSHEAKVNG